jgi:hypothetical protein
MRAARIRIRIDLFRTRQKVLDPTPDPDPQHCLSELFYKVPPLFLRFLNLLVNDAIFLLDEGLNYMRTIQVVTELFP